MARFNDYIPHGVIPAALLAFDDDFAIDEAATRRHLRHVADVAGITAITVNGHSSEVHACTFDEQARLLDIAGDEIGDRVPLINGIYADGSLEAVRLARMAEAGGASALLCFPPHSMRMGGVRHRPEMALTHFKMIAAATDLPLIVFQYGDELAYSLDTLVDLAEDIPAVKAVKDWSPAQDHERHIQVLQSLPRPVNVLSTNSAWPLSSLVMGANGLLSGAGSVIADLQVALRRRAGRRPDQRQGAGQPYLAHLAGVLRRPVRRHAQSHERSAGAARPAGRRGGAAAAGQTAGNRNRPHRRSARRRRPAHRRRNGPASAARRGGVGRAAALPGADLTRLGIMACSSPASLGL
jgi:4-hydroxy-tetrahydrodipicolinate synthase